VSVDLDNDLNATIANAVNARIEASVMAALSSDDVLGKYVAAALNQPISIDRNYRKIETTYLQHTLRASVQEATKAALVRVLTEDQELIEDEVRKALRRNVAGIAAGIAGSIADHAKKGYGVQVTVRLPGESD
jgi:AAA+ superfamily predicted ATPase